MSVDDIKHWLMGAAVVSLIGGILLIVLDFAGWYNYNAGVETWGWIGFQGFEEGNFVGILFIFLGLSLFYTTSISILALAKPDTFEPTRKTLLIGFFNALAVFLIVLIGGIVFEVVLAIDDPTNWWLGGGFYAGIIGAPMTAFFLYMCLRGTS